MKTFIFVFIFPLLSFAQELTCLSHLKQHSRESRQKAKGSLKLKGVILSIESSYEFIRNPQKPITPELRDLYFYVDGRDYHKLTFESLSRQVIDFNELYPNCEVKDLEGFSLNFLVL